MEKLTKELKLKFIFMFLISNLSTFMIASTTKIETTSLEVDSQELIPRPDHIELALAVQIRAELVFNKPYVLTNMKRSLYIPYVFFINKLKLETLSEYPEVSELASEKLILSIPKNSISKLLDRRDLMLIPQIEKKLIHKHNQRRTYEINF